MKIAIASEGKTLSDKMDNRFGRCSYFAIYDTEKKQTEFFSNPGKDAQGGAGSAAARFIAEKEVDKVVATEIGGKALPVLESLKIEIIYRSNISIKEIIDSL